jgi:type I restriction enzyme S subunit
MLESGTVLVAMYGGFNQIGRTGLMTFQGTINQAISALIVDRQQAVPEYLLYWLNGNVSAWKRIAASSRKDPNITGRDVAAFPVLLPPLAEQSKIAQILGTWDTAIARVEQLIAALQLRKKGLMQRLFTGQVRFPKFADVSEKRTTKYGSLPADWNYVPLSEIAHEVSLRNTFGGDLPVLSCTKYEGLVDSLEYFGRQIFSKDTSTYKVVKRGQFAYATNHIEEGSIGYQDKYDAGLISPMYTVFATNGQVNDDFLYRLLKTELYRHIFEVNTSGTVDRRGRLAWSDFSRINVPLPSLEEQQRIIDALAIVDREIRLQTRYMERLRQQKKGLMQRLLTGRVRVQV